MYQKLHITIWGK